jgi:micrococcal nuclease
MVMPVKRPRRNSRWYFSAGVVLVVALVIVAVRLVEQIGPDRALTDRFVVARIVDGDTVELRGGDVLRLLAIDTPEKGEPFYHEAADLLRELSFNKTAKIEFAGSRRDKYGRLLGYLYADSLFVNREILRHGLGYLYLFRDNELKQDRVRLLLEAQRQAMRDKVGLWSLKREPEEYYVQKAGSFRLHRPGCRSVANLREGNYRVFQTREEGLATGLSPCRNCKP